jgi:hypothetical protein
MSSTVCSTLADAVSSTFFGLSGDDEGEAGDGPAAFGVAAGLERAALTGTGQITPQPEHWILLRW